MNDSGPGAADLPTAEQRASAESLGRAYREGNPQFGDLDLPPINFFGDSPTMIEELLALVITGTKRATAGSVLDYADADEPVPTIGDHWLVGDSAERSRLVLRTTDVRIGVLSSVYDAFAWDEGEGDRTRDGWLTGHRRYFTRALVRRPDSDPADLESLPIVLERFVAVWPPEFMTEDDRAAVAQLDRTVDNPEDDAGLE